jgi:hypothetical protein
VAIGALSDTNESLVTDVPISVEFFRPDGTPAGSVPARFMWAIPDVRGMWITDFTFDAHGGWTLGIRTADERLIRSAPFSVSSQTTTVGIGDTAPLSTSKTLDTGSYAEITSDLAPDDRFYQQTVAEAVSSGSPSVIVFSTPAWCISATCGPVLDVAKIVASEFPDVAWVHVEVFDNLDASSREELVPVLAVAEWRLATEPWVFVVDAAGVIQARFEGAMDDVELRNALESVSN